MKMTGHMERGVRVGREDAGRVQRVREKREERYHFAQ